MSETDPTAATEPDVALTRVAPCATRREWIGLTVLALPTLLLSLDVSMLYLALPHVSIDIGADNTSP